MKKLWISIGLALGLFATPMHKATAQDETTATPKPTMSLSMYAYQSSVQTFYDLSTLVQNGDAYTLPADENSRFTFKQSITLGGDLEKDVALQNLFFVANKQFYANDNPDETAEKYSSETIAPTLAADATERNQLALPFPQDFGLTHFCGQDVSGFAIAAIGGILFTDATANAAGYSVPGINCQNADGIKADAAKNFLRVRPLNYDVLRPEDGLIAPTKGDKAPVILTFATDEVKRQACIWVQFDYMVGEMNWVFQIRYYADGQSDFIIKSLGTAEQWGALDYRFTPVVLKDKDNNIGIMNAPDINNKETNWNVITTEAYNAWKGMRLSKDALPAEGQTLSIIPDIEPAALSLPADHMTAEFTALHGKMLLDPTKTSAASLEAVDAICATITTSYWIAAGADGLPTDKIPELGFKTNYLQVVYVGKPDNLSQTAELPIVAENLEPNTEYYIHLYRYAHKPEAKIPYTFANKAKNAIGSFGPFKTPAIPTVEDVNATIADGKVHLTFKPTDGLSTMVVKSPNPSPKTPSGKLKVGDLIGYSYEPQDTVVALLTGGESAFDLLFDVKAGEGFFIHLYYVVNASDTKCLYSGATSTSAYRPAETLPIEWTPTATASSKALPLGWSRGDLADQTADYEDAAFQFIYTDGYALTSYNKTLVAGQMQADVITPAFISPLDEITATFNIKFYNVVSGWDYQARIPQDGDSVRIEYRLDGGNWQTAQLFKEFPDADETGNTTLYANITGAMGKRVEWRYTRYTSTINTANSLTSVHITKSITCFPPTGLIIDTANVSDRQIALRWHDEDNATATYIVAYQEAGAIETGNWVMTAADGKTALLTELKPLTAYRMQVQAVCAADDSSAFNAVPIHFTTYASIPYTESLGHVYGSSGSPFDYTTPAERGVETYKGRIGQTWTAETNRTDTWATGNSSSYQRNEDPTAMGIHEEISNGAILCLPRIVTTDMTELSFTLNSFSAKFNEAAGIREVVNGVSPTENDATLRVAVSNNGAFTAEDVILTLTGPELQLTDSTFKLRINTTGILQIAFIFETPVKHGDDAFYLEAYDLNLKTMPNEYTLTLTATPDKGGRLTGAGKHAEGDVVTITAIPNVDYDFVAWMDGDAQLSTSASYTFQMPSADVSYTAVFQSKTPSYQLTLTASPAHGGTLTGDGTYHEGDTVTITAMAGKDYEFIAWLSDTDTLSKEAAYTFRMPKQDTSFTALFAIKPVANEEALQADFSLSAKAGHLYVRNLGGLTVKNVTVYDLSGHCIERFTANSREDLMLPVRAGRTLLFVRIATEKGAAVYKVYLP